jgi:hypothetical protein
MSHLNDLQRGSGIVRDHALTESLLDAKIAEEISDFELLSYGPNGRWVFDLLNSPNLEVCANGQGTGRKIQHYVVALNDVEPTTAQSFGVKSGKELGTKSGVAAIKKENPYEAYKFFDQVVDSHPSNPDPTNINNWYRYRAVALGVKLNFLTGRIASMYRKDVGLTDGKLWQFVHARVLTHTPDGMRKEWANQTAPVAKSEEPKAKPEKAPKPAKKHESGVPSLAVALEQSGNSK